MTIASADNSIDCILQNSTLKKGSKKGLVPDHARNYIAIVGASKIRQEVQYSLFDKQCLGSANLAQSRLALASALVQRAGFLTLAISDIVSDEDVPEELQPDPELWSG